MDWFYGFSKDKAKAYLKMSMHRIEIVKAKRTNGIKQSKKQVAQLLAMDPPKEEKARIRAEHVVREDFGIEAYDILELLCELVLERLNLIASEKECPFDMREAVCTLIYAANRTEVPELIKVKAQFGKKYGSEFVDAAKRNKDKCVNARIIQKLSAQPPNSWIVLNYMKEIAKEFNVAWEPSKETEDAGKRFDAPMLAPKGADVVMGAASGVSKPYAATDGTINATGAAPTYSYPNARPVQPPMGGASTPGGYVNMGNVGGGGNIPMAQTVPPVAPTASFPSSGAGGGNNGGGGFSGGLDIPAAPTAKIDANSSSNDNNSGGGGGLMDVGNLPKAPPSLPFAAPPAAPSASASAPSVSDPDGAIPGYDELAARFNALRK